MDDTKDRKKGGGWGGGGKEDLGRSCLFDFNFRLVWSGVELGVFFFVVGVVVVDILASHISCLYVYSEYYPILFFSFVLSFPLFPLPFSV